MFWSGIQFAVFPVLWHVCINKSYYVKAFSPCSLHSTLNVTLNTPDFSRASLNYQYALESLWNVNIRWPKWRGLNKCIRQILNRTWAFFVMLKSFLFFVFIYGGKTGKTSINNRYVSCANVKSQRKTSFSFHCTSCLYHIILSPAKQRSVSTVPGLVTA